MQSGPYTPRNVIDVDAIGIHVPTIADIRRVIRILAGRTQPPPAATTILIQSLFPAGNPRRMFAIVIRRKSIVAFHDIIKRQQGDFVLRVLPSFRTISCVIRIFIRPGENARFLRFRKRIIQKFSVQPGAERAILPCNLCNPLIILLFFQDPV